MLDTAPSLTFPGLITFRPGSTLKFRWDTTALTALCPVPKSVSYGLTILGAITISYDEYWRYGGFVEIRGLHFANCTSPRSVASQ